LISLVGAKINLQFSFTDIATFAVINIITFNMRGLLFALAFLFSISAQAQLKTDVLVVGASASGSATALQAARSGVKVILIETGNVLIGDAHPDLNIPSFDTGIWKEWRDSSKKDIDSLKIDPRVTLENIIYKTKNLKFYKNLQIVAVKQKGKGWEATINRNGKKETIKSKILVSAEFNTEDDIVSKFKLLDLADGKINAIAEYNPAQEKAPYQQKEKIYRTSGATGFGKDSALHFLPLGAFISQENPRLLVVNNRAALKGFDVNAFKNIALWANAGQMVGALAAYGPFFDTTPDKANIRLTQGEIINFKNIFYPVLDVKPESYAWIPVQKMIASQILEHNFAEGKFYPENAVLKEDIRAILSELHPRSRIWFLENASAQELLLKETISLLSFISGKEQFSIQEELKSAWKNKYKFNTDYNESKIITREEFSVLADAYLNPFTIRVDMKGYYIR